jgi:hypothetical protein
MPLASPLTTSLPPAGHAHEPGPRIVPSSGHRARAQLATVALVVATLVLGLAAVWQSTSVLDNGLRPPALIRALASAPGDVVDEQLLETTFSAAELPTGDREAVFYRLTLPPGASLPFLVGPLCGCRARLAKAGAGAELIQSGAYTLRLEAPIRLQRAGASDALVDVPAGSEVTLEPGDTAIYPDYTAPGRISNGGNEPVVVVGVAINSIEGSGDPTPTLPPGVELELLASTPSAEWRSLPAGPVSVSIWRLALPAATSAGPYEATGLESLWIEKGEILHSLLRPGETKPRGRPLFHPAGTGTPVMALAPGVQHVISSKDDKPAELLVLSIEPAGVWSRTLAP